MRNPTRILARAALAVALPLAFAGCSSSKKSSSDTTTGATTSVAPGTTAKAADAVTIRDFSFNPSPIRVKVGTTITWTNRDSFAHTVFSSGPRKFDSGHIDSGKTFRLSFPKAGTYQYVCGIHNFMNGTVIVQ